MYLAFASVSVRTHLRLSHEANQASLGNYSASQRNDHAPDGMSPRVFVKLSRERLCLDGHVATAAWRVPIKDRMFHRTKQQFENISVA
jgi:hypothetical protein